MNGKRFVLVIEDDEEVQRTIEDQFKACFGDRLSLLRASSIEEAWQLFKAHLQELALIAVDGMLGRKASLELIAEMRCVFRGPMIAMSCLPLLRAEQVSKGCSRALQDKANLVTLIAEILDESQPV